MLLLTRAFAEAGQSCFFVSLLVVIALPQRVVVVEDLAIMHNNRAGAWFDAVAVVFCL